jgi:methyl-accepting chemotaxis protein
MSLQQQFETRRISIGLDKRELTDIAAIAAEAHQAAMAGVDAYHQRLAKLDAYRAWHEKHAEGFTQQVSRHLAIVGAGRFDDAYEQSLQDILTFERNMGYGSRGHVGVSIAALLSLLEHFGRKHRFSGQKATAVSATFVKLIALDLLAIMRLENETHKSELQARTQQSESAIETVSGVAARMRGNLDSMAVELSAAAEQSSKRSSEMLVELEEAERAIDETFAVVSTSATASEELSVSIQDIGAQSVRGRDVADHAVSQTEQMNDAVAALAEALAKIGSFTDSIRSIAAQTNLLALNATIEAARAGEAGRGFAVVAGEVKQLASQTASATDQITGQVNAVQDAASRLMEEISAFNVQMKDMAAASRSIAGAVDQQMAVTREIAGYAVDAARKTEDFQNVVRHARTAMAELGEAARSVSDRSSEISRESKGFGDELKSFVDKFKVA